MPGVNHAKLKMARHGDATTQTHIVFEVLVRAGIQQQPNAGRLALVGGPHQRRVSVLRIFARATPPQTEIASISHADTHTMKNPAWPSSS
jgi:hypothetical protein